MVHKDIIQRKKYLEETVDKIIVCLVGQPRGISLKCWRESLTVQFENTFYGRDNKDCLPHGVQTKRPEIHFVCSTWNEDSLDRYVSNVYDSSRFNSVPSISNVWYTGNTTGFGREIDSGKIRGLIGTENVNLSSNLTLDGNYLGNIKLKKEKFMNYCNEVFDWADSVRFSFPSPYEVINRIKLKSKSPINWDSPLWLGQHLMFIQSIRDYPDELFNESSSNTLILRMRWDTFIHPKLTLWDFVDILFLNGGTDRLSPMVGSCEYLPPVRDEWNVFNDKGAEIFANDLEDWLINLSGDWALDANITSPEQKLTRFYEDKKFNIISPNNIKNYDNENAYETTIYNRSILPTSPIGIIRDTGDPKYEFFVKNKLTNLLDTWRTDWYEWDNTEI